MACTIERPPCTMGQKSLYLITDPHYTYFVKCQKCNKNCPRVKFDIKFEFFGQFYPKEQSLRTIGQQEKNQFFFSKRILRIGL